MSAVSTLSVLPCPGAVADDLGAFLLYTVANVAGLPVLPSDPSRSHGGRLYVPGMGGETDSTARGELEGYADAVNPNGGHLSEDSRTWLRDVLAPPPPCTYRELRAARDAIVSAEPGYGTPNYRGDPYEAVALTQAADRLVDDMARRLVERDVCYCVSGLVAKLFESVDACDGSPVLDDELSMALASRAPDADDYREAAAYTDDHGTLAVVQEDGEWRWKWTPSEARDLGDPDLIEFGDSYDGTEAGAWRAGFDERGYDHPDGSEAFEHWAITDDLGRRLREQGESVADDVYGVTIWARCTTGQAIYGDAVFQRIARDILEA